MPNEVRLSELIGVILILHPPTFDTHRPREGGGLRVAKNIITIIKTIVISSRVFGGCRCGCAGKQRNPFKLEPAFARGDLFKMSNLVRIQLKMKTLVSLGLTAMVCQ